MFVVLQYGRQNIENVRKRNGTWDSGKDFNVEEECESPTILPKNSTVTSSKTQNGSLGNSVIARSKDLILVPEPEAQNHKNHINESNLKNNCEVSAINSKEVRFVEEKMLDEIQFGGILHL